MHSDDKLEAKNRLLKLVGVAPIRVKGAAVQFGTCRGEFIIGDDNDASNAEIAAMFDFSLPITAKAR